MSMFTWWDARGRRLPWLMVMVIVGCVVAVLVCPPAEPKAEGWVVLRRVEVRSQADAKAACYYAEYWFRTAWRCEGWHGGGCHRQSLTQPNIVYCFPSFFMSNQASSPPQHMDCNRMSRYVYRRGALRLTVAGTTRWKCRIARGLPS